MNKLYKVLILLVFFGLGIPCASAANTISFNPQITQMGIGSSQNFQLVIDEVPDGLSGFDLNISVLDPNVAEITAVSFPTWSSLPKNSPVPSSSVSIQVVDLNKTDPFDEPGEIKPGATNVWLGNITITGKNAGTSDLNISEGSYYDPDGNFTAHSIPNAVLGQINVLDKELSVFPDYTNTPTDPNYDGLYEDATGDGKVDLDDVVAYYDNMYWIEQNAPVALFDYNKNSIIDFDDVVILYNVI
jgi:PKD repeat protein